MKNKMSRIPKQLLRSSKKVRNQRKKRKNRRKFHKRRASITKSRFSRRQSLRECERQSLKSSGFKISVLLVYARLRTKLMRQRMLKPVRKIKMALLKNLM